MTDPNEWTVKFDFQKFMADGGIDIGKSKDSSGLIATDDHFTLCGKAFPTPEELKEKYKLTPAEEEHNKIVKLSKEWGTRNDLEIITPYTKAVKAGELNALTLYDENVDNQDPTSVIMSIWKSSILPASTSLFSMTTSISQKLKSFQNKKDFIKFLKKENIDISKDLNEETVEKILDKWPDFFEDVESVDFNEGEEKQVAKIDEDCLFQERPMEVPKDSIYYIEPMYSATNAKGEMSFDIELDDTLVNLNDPPEPTPMKPEKLSWKKQQRMKNKNPMWKQKC